MKFIHYLESIAGIAIYPMTSLFIFFIFFSVLLFYMLKINKTHLKELENIPFNSDKN